MDDALVQDDGIDLILEGLDRCWEVTQDQDKASKIEKALFETQRDVKMETTYVARKKLNFQQLENALGTPLPAVIKGYATLREAKLAESSCDKVVMWTGGRYDYDVVVRALVRLDRPEVRPGTSGQSGKTVPTYFTDPEVDAPTIVPGSEIWTQPSMDQPHWNEVLDALQEDVDFCEDGETTIARDVAIAISGGFFITDDGQEAIEENEVPQILLQAGLNVAQTSRGFFGPRRGASGRDQGPRMNRSSIQQLKLHTRCARCRKLGHWARECPDRNRGQRNDERYDRRAVRPEENSKGFITVAKPTERRPFFFGASWTFVTLDPGEVLWDTGAQEGLVGKQQIDKWFKLLAENGLQVGWSQKKPKSASGIGGVTQPNGVENVPLGLAGCNGIIRFTVVEQDVPPLLPMVMMRTLQACLDLTDDGDKVIFRQFGGESSLRTLQSEHTVIRADQFDPDCWQLPGITELRQNNDEGCATNCVSVIAHGYQRPRCMDNNTPGGDHDPASTRSCRPRRKTTSNGDGPTRSHPTNLPTSSPRFKSGEQTHGAFQNHGRDIWTSEATSPGENQRQGTLWTTEQWKRFAHYVLYVRCAAFFDTVRGLPACIATTGATRDEEQEEQCCEPSGGPAGARQSLTERQQVNPVEEGAERLRSSTDCDPVRRQHCDVLRTMRDVRESVAAHSPDHGGTGSRDDAEQSHNACVHREATGRDRTPLLSTRTQAHDDAGHATAQPPLRMLDVQYNLRNQPGRVRCSTCGPGELRGCRREHGSHWGRRNTVSLQVQQQLKGVDQEACLQLIYETGQRPESQITTLGLVPRQKVESGEQVTESFNTPEGFFQLHCARVPTDEVGSSPGASGHRKEYGSNVPESKSPVKNATRESGCEERWDDTTFARI